MWWAWWNQVSLSSMRDAAGTVTHVIGVQQDVTAQVMAEADVRRMGDTDSLNGLPNRTAGLREVERLLSGNACGRDTGQFAVALAFYGLDGFKQVNDRHAPVVGDELLATIARGISERGRQAVPASDAGVTAGR